MSATSLRVKPVRILAALALVAAASAASEDLVDRWQAEWPRTDFSKRTVKLEEIESGGPPKDGIPSIDRPMFYTTEVAAQRFDAREPVIAIEIAGDARAYPLSILIWHEIVNDTVGKVPVAVTFCPLCNASLVFERRVGGRTLDFGTTGKLRLSDLVMYDRQTQSWWQQFTGAGIVGEYADVKLKQIPSQIVSFADFRSAHPGGRVLSHSTGTPRPYGRNPYQGYDRIDQSPFLLAGPPDPRLPPMERVIAVEARGKQRIYPFAALAREPVINDHVGGEPVVVLSKQGTLSVLDREQITASKEIPSATAFSRRVKGRVLEFALKDGKIRDLQTGSEWTLLGHAVSGPMQGERLVPMTGGVHFAFAWLAFKADTDIYRGRQ